MNKIDMTPFVIVVEGTSDVAFLSSFIDAEFVITNGSSVPRETIEYLMQIALNKEIIILTDPDYPGQQIRHKIETHVANVKHAYVTKALSIKKNKVGVAECDKKEVIRALQHVMSDSNANNQTGTLTTKDLYELKLIGAEDSANRRNYIMEIFNVGFCNGKTLLKRLNAIGISKEKICERMRKYDEQY